MIFATQNMPSIVLVSWRRNRPRLFSVAGALFALAVQTALAEPMVPGPESRAGQPSMMVIQLKTEHLVEPIGVERLHPRFRWQMESTERGRLQTAYQILVASSLNQLEADKADKWDSGKVISDNSVEVIYGGSDLSSGERCYWKVRVWDQSGKPTVYSSPSFFEMGLLKASDWNGKWIAAKKGISSPIFRREIDLNGSVRRARVYIAGVGYYELYINGKRVGDRVLEPAHTYYNNDQPFHLDSRVLYAAYDVTSYLQPGKNALGVMLGNGWYSADVGVASSIARTPYGDRPLLMMQTNIELDGGQKVIMASDPEWKVSPGPVTYNDFFHGETYDARLEQSGWNRVGFNDSSWEHASVAEAPSGKLTAEMLPPSRVMETLPMQRMLVPKEPEMYDKTYIYDFGQTFTGWVRITVSGPKGAKVVLRYGSRIYEEDNTLDNRSNLLRFPTPSAKQTDTYILKGEGTEVWEPRFTLHGFRYVEVTGFRDAPSVENIEGRFVHSSLDPTGSFVSSNKLLNQIHHNIQWTFMSSFQGLLQDASDRSERVGWLGDPTFVAEDYLYNYDMSTFLEKWMNDIKDNEKDDGNIPFISPIDWRPPKDAHEDPDSLTGFTVYTLWPCWQSTYPLMTWYLYEYYGDKQVLEDQYAGIKKFIDFLSANAVDHMIMTGLGDHMEPQDNGFSHFSPRRTPSGLTSTAYYYANTLALSRMASVLGRSDDAKKYATLAQNIKEAFNKRYFDPSTNQYATGSQTSNALPVYLDMAPPERVPAIVKNLVDDIVTRHDTHVSTGIIGSNAVIQVLPSHGATALMYALANQTTYPSLGNQVTKGATTICETYECGPWLSQNMKMFGSMDKYFYRDLAGISSESPGYRRILIKPQPVGDLRTVSASEQTVRGPVSVDWVKGDGALDLKVSVPTGAEADVSIPQLGLTDIQITEGGQPVWHANAYVAGDAGITGAETNTDSIVFHVGSGSYSFAMSGSTY